MAVPRIATGFAGLLLAWLAAASPALGATGEASQQAGIDALTRAHHAVVGLQVKAAEGARSAETLGRERIGSGVVIDPDGLILTIGYLVLEADSIQVLTHDRRTLPARAVAYDLATGFGLVRSLLPLRGTAPVDLGSAATVQEGEALMAVAGGAGGGVAVTRLVSQRPFSGYWEYHIASALFTTPPLPNHSGAALFDQRGQLLGIGSLLVGDALGDNRALPGNMFVPVDLLKPVLAELQASGSTRASRRPWLGLNSTVHGGRVHIVRVTPDSPAQAAGLAAGDVVLAIDGEQVATLQAFYEKLWSRAEPDDEVRLTVLQGKEIRQIVLKGVDRMNTLRRPAGI